MPKASRAKGGKSSAKTVHKKTSLLSKSIKSPLGRSKVVSVGSSATAKNASNKSDDAVGENVGSKTTTDQQQQQQPQRQRDGTHNSNNSGVLTKGQIKKLAKNLPYAKRKQLIMSSLRLKRAETKEPPRLEGMDTLKEALDAVVAKDEQRKATPVKTPVVVTNKAKKELELKEINHMGLVLEHPSFQENPFATIQEHLKNSLAAQAEKHKALHKESKKKEIAENAEKKRQKKEAKKARPIKKMYKRAVVNKNSGRGRRRR